jgi:phenylacetate-CoA ligase
MQNPAPTANTSAGGPVFGRFLLKVAHRLRGGQSLELLEQIRRAPFTSPEQVRAHQFELLSKLLAHAETNVPYYREMFRKLGIHSTDIRNFSDFSGLPVLTKDIIRERLDDLRRHDRDPAALWTHHSGGSTGVPLKFYRDQTYMDYSDAGTFRNMMQCGWLPGEMVAFFWGGNDRMYAMSRWEFEMRQVLRRMYQFDPFHSGPADMDRWIARWRTLRPAAILGYASTIARFAQHIEAGRISIGAVKGVFTTAEKLYPEQRAVIERVFGCRVFDCYGSSEVQQIAAECPLGRMHINADFVVMETDHSPEGMPPPLLVTSLRNYAMPFIRYRNEDCGELSEEQCTCGNHFPLMKLKIARVSDNFVLPGKRVVHGEYFTHLMYGTEGIATFQFHQTAPDSITVWIVPGPGAAEARDRAIQSITEQIRGLSPDAPVNVVIRETDAIPLSSAGKHRFTRSDVKL